MITWIGGKNAPFSRIMVLAKIPTTIIFNIDFFCHGHFLVPPFFMINKTSMRGEIHPIEEHLSLLGWLVLLRWLPLMFLCKFFYRNNIFHNDANTWND
jgi:hypothetical protein